MPGQLPFEIDCREVKALLDAGEDFLLLDVRKQEEYDLVHLDAAKLVPIQEIQDRAGELAPYRERRIVVHCHLGGRSARVAAWLREQGFSQAQNMAGGIDAWAQDVDPALPRY